MKNIALIGMSGTMKSSVGKELAKLTGRMLFDTDSVIEYENGASAACIIERSGIAYFRRLENGVVKRACESENVVIAAGGGAVINDDNLSLLSRTAIIVLLTAEPSTIYKRLSEGAEQRPLLTPLSVEGIFNMMCERNNAYHKCADIIVPTDGKISIEVARIIFNILCAQNEAYFSS
ncbi:MAG: shikimate kinase [Clostridia bacterium]|nr:shikimate kinase [Clostridia bacterium]